MCACVKSACRLLECCCSEMYTTCLPCNYSKLVRKAILGCFPRKTAVQRTYVRPLVNLTSYLHVTYIPKLGLKLEKLWNCLAMRRQITREV